MSDAPIFDSVVDNDDESTPEYAEMYYVVRFTASGFNVHSVSDDKDGAHRVAKDNGCVVLTVSHSEDE